MSAAPVIRDLSDLPGLPTATADALRHAGITVPGAVPADTFLEIWEPGRSEPLSLSGDRSEICIVLSGQAHGHLAGADGTVTLVELEAGDVVVLRPGDEQRIHNSSATERLFTLVMVPTDRDTGNELEAQYADTIASGSVKVRTGGESPRPDRVLSVG